MLRICFLMLISLDVLLGCSYQTIAATENQSSSERISTPPKAKVVRLLAEEARHVQQTNPEPVLLWNYLQSEFEFPAIRHPSIAKERQRYLNDPRYMRVVSKRAAPFIGYIVAEIERRKLPLELALLPFVESAFETRAVSEEQAAGVWQLMRAASQRFNLHQDRWYDGRLDIHASTHAALDYLTFLHRYFGGDWLLAIAAYNSGEGRVRRAIRHNKKHKKPTDFWSLSLPQETRVYVPRLLALKDIIVNARMYQVTLPELHLAPKVQAVLIEDQIDLAFAAQMAGLSVTHLQNYNPGLLRHATSPQQHVHLLLPHEHARRLQKTLRTTPTSQWMPWREYRIRAGDSLSTIAHKFRIDIQDLRRFNALKDNLIRTGQTLRIPRSVRETQKHAKQASVVVKTKKYVVKKGDSLWTIARKHDTKVQQIRQWNQLKYHKPIRPGQELIVRN